MAKLIKILIGLFVVLILGLIIIISLIDLNQYKDEVIQIVEENTGRNFNIEGEFSLAISLVPTIVVEGVSFANAEWGSQENMLTVGRLEVQVSLIPLISGNLQVNRLILNSPQIFLETNSSGEGNWLLGLDERLEEQPQAAETNGSGQLPGLVIHDILIDDMNLTYKDGVTGKTTELGIEEITLNGSGYDKPLQFALSAIYNNNPVRLSGTIGSPEQLITDESFKVDLSGNIANADLAIKGSIDKPKSAKGLVLKLNFNVDSLKGLSSLAETELPEFGPLSFAGTLKDTDDGYALNDMALQAGPHDLAGDLSIDMSADKPSVIAKLTSNIIDVTGPVVEEEVDLPPDAKLFSSDPLPLEGLMAANADISIHAKTIKSNAATLNDTNIGIKLNNGRLVISPLTSNIAGGTLASTLNLDASNGKSAKLSINLDIKGLIPGQLPSLEGQMTGGSTDLSLNANGSGENVAAMMAGLNAKILIQTGKGVIKSKEANVATSNVLMEAFNKLNPGSEEKEGSELECFVAKIDIKDGIAEIDNSIALQTNSLNVIGNGMLDFKNETLDLGVEPQAREGLGINMSQLAELVRLKGTFAHPSVGTDTKAALKAGLSVGAAVATGGLSILAQGLFDKTTAEEDPCALALGIKTAEAPEPEPEPEETAEAPATNKIEEAANAIKDNFKSLFGK